MGWSCFSEGGGGSGKRLGSRPLRPSSSGSTLGPSSEDFLNRLWTNLRRLWMMVVVGAAYAYELRQADRVVSTGRLTMEDQLELGDELTVAGVVASVTELRWVGGESRLLLEPVPTPSRS